jgi:hypothetical protein
VRVSRVCGKAFLLGQLGFLGSAQLGSRIDRGEQFRHLGRHRDGGDRNVGVRSRRIHERNRLIGDRFGGMNIQREQRSRRCEQQPTHGNPFLVCRRYFINSRRKMV